MPTYIKGKYKCAECGATFTAPTKDKENMTDQQWFEMARMKEGAKLH